MVIFLVMHPVGSVSLRSFVLLGRLALLLASVLAVDCWLRDFLDRAIGVVDFLKHFLNFIDDTMIWSLNSKLDLNLSCAKDVLNLNSLVTWCINWRRLLALVIFQLGLLRWCLIIKRFAMALVCCNRQRARRSARSRWAALLSSFVGRQWVGLWTLWRFRLKGLSIDEMVGAWCFGCCRARRGLPFGLLLLRYSVLCTVEPLSFSFLYIDLYVLGNDAWIS